MKTPQAVTTFNDRYPLIGPSFWIVSLQYFLIQLIAALAWARPYSLSRNTISDLGNTACAQYGSRFVCSPLHLLMNVSFVLLGCTMIAGSSLIYQEFREGKAAIVGFAFMTIAGLGTILVGLFPENTIGPLHLSGAALVFLIGNLGIIILGISLDIPKPLRLYTILSGIVALSATILFFIHQNLGLGSGGIERFAAYPQTIWLIIFGLYMGRRHLQKSG
ncbi:MAG TPA: DUF998 domain-containing protein [Candidatus Saccharimonadales bacterium]|nr:DUF998 domain-containing protein [Candidatus Saccharimonadales bacterium]